jgi:hypothetical protein
MVEPSATPAPAEGRLDAARSWLIRWVQRPGLAWRLAALAMLLASPCLLLGLYLDDYVGRYIYSDKPGAAHLFELYAGGYGLARGDPAELKWQIENGYAPWWAVEDLRLVLYRPIGVLFHRLDMTLSPFVQHLHSLLWLGLLVLLTTRMYRAANGALVGGLAALLFALDHTHGFAVGYISNRYALITAALCAACLHSHMEARRQGRFPLLAPLLLVAALLAGESAVAVVGYVAAFALVDEAPWKKRVLAVAPYVFIVLLWRSLYTLAGFGASGSGLYIDAGREPARFLQELLVRGPVLLLGQFLLPPAELYTAGVPALTLGMLLGGLALSLMLAVALVPLLRVDRMARFWALGMVAALVPAAATYPQNRQLLFASFGAMALIAQLWRFHAGTLGAARRPALLRLSAGVGKVLLFVHLFISPLLKPLTTCGIAAAAPLQRSIDSVGDDIAGRDVVFVTAPDYFATKLPQLSRRIEGRPLPRRWRALSFGPEPITVFRPDLHTLELTFDGGILSHPFLELYRDRRRAMLPGQRLELSGLSIEVLAVTDDGRLQRARFTFDQPLDAASFKFFAWKDDGFAPFELPKVGGGERLAPARVEWALPGAASSRRRASASD